MVAFPFQEDRKLEAELLTARQVQDRSAVAGKSPDPRQAPAIPTDQQVQDRREVVEAALRSLRVPLERLMDRLLQDRLPAEVDEYPDLPASPVLPTDR